MIFKIILIGVSIMSGELLGQIAGGVIGAIGTHRQNQQNQHLMDRYAKNSTTWMLRQCMAQGIHPAACMGVSSGHSPSIPMQNPMSAMSGALIAQNIDPDTGINRELKEYALKEAKRREKDAQWRNSILIPVTHPDLPQGKKLWAFNSRFAMFGTVSQGLVLAANSDEAWGYIMQKASPEEKRKLQQLRNQTKQHKRKKQDKDNRPGGGMNLGIGGM